jgi:hypothetical protein
MLLNVDMSHVILDVSGTGPGPYGWWRSGERKKWTVGNDESMMIGSRRLEETRLEPHPSAGERRKAEEKFLETGLRKFETVTGRNAWLFR